MRRVAIVGISDNAEVRGVERYALEILKKLALESRGDWQIILYAAHWQLYYSELMDFGVQVRYLNIPRAKILRHLYIVFILPFLIGACDVVHYLNTLPIVFGFSKKKVITIHDLAEYEIPNKYDYIQSSYRRLVVRFSSRVADKVITVSNYSKKSLRRYLSLPDEKVVVIYNGIDHCIKSEMPVSDLDLSYVNNISTSPFLLFMSVLEKGKGIEQLIKAFEVVSAEYSDLRLVLIGKDGNLGEYVTRICQENPRILKTGFLSDVVVHELMRKCRAVAFTSEFEGFGFPVLEGYYFNGNVVASSTTSVGEISSEFAYLVNPLSVESIVWGLKQALDFPCEVNYEIKSRVLTKYDWLLAARATLQVYSLD